MTTTRITDHLSRPPFRQTQAEIAAALGLLPVQVANRVDALVAARLVERDAGGRVALKGCWYVRHAAGCVGPFHLRTAEALERAVDGRLELEAVT
jgi:DNA-binding IclR family transcriptional regulator